jgi:long-chain acyl-CoA synthetase
VGSQSLTGSLALLLAQRVAEGPDDPLVFVEEEGPWRAGQLAEAATDLAHTLAVAGVDRGQRVIVRLGNDERFLVALVAIWLRRAAAIAVHPAVPVDDVLRVIADFGAVGVVADPADRARDLIEVPVVDGCRVDLAAASATRLDVPDGVADDDEAILLLTSGSTGAPKGVVLTHANGWSNLRATTSAFRRGRRGGSGQPGGPTPPGRADRPPNLVANPFSHTGGLVRLLIALHVGRSLVVLRKFDAVKALAAVHRHGIDNLTINPTMIRMLLDAVPEGEGLGSVRYVSSGTAPLSPSLRDEFETRFHVPVLQVYGQTETFGAVAMESPHDVLAGGRRPDSVGRPLPGVEVRIAQGEILVRSQSATSGYAAAGGASSPVDGDGWLHTGDLGHLDSDGYLYVTGRLKNLIICGGFNIVPEELEARLEADPDVREAAVVAVADRKLGEIPVALVAARGDAAAILERTKPQLVAYKRPRHLFVVDVLPRLASGKVDKPAATLLAEKLVANETARP